MSKVIQSSNLPIIDLESVVEDMIATGRQVSVLWQYPGSLAFVAKGRDYRSEFHINASEEVTYMIRGTMNLHHRTPEGVESIAVIPAGSSNWMPSNTEHSPRFPSDAFALILERGRLEGEIDRFRWYCPECDEFLHEEEYVVEDYTLDPVSKAYARFFDSVEARTCTHCGHVMPRPEEQVG